MQHAFSTTSVKEPGVSVTVSVDLLTSVDSPRHSTDTGTITTGKEWSYMVAFLPTEPEAPADFLNLTGL